MKINTWNSSPGYLPVVREKLDGQSPGHKGEGGQPGQKNDSQEETPERESNTQEVGQAVVEFQTEMDARTNGLNASITGSGPGLKVILKDGMGSVVRQFTGEEFLRLRQAATKDGRIQGKILDQKL